MSPAAGESSSGGAGPGAHPPGPAGLPAGHVRGGQRRGGAARLPALRVLLPPSPRQSRQAPPGAEGAAREAPRAEAHRRQPGRQRGGDPGAGLVPVRAQCNNIAIYYVYNIPDRAQVEKRDARASPPAMRDAPPPPPPQMRDFQFLRPDQQGRAVGDAKRSRLGWLAGAYILSPLL
eukprot:1184687-Prorocentrum_minimum.AAC.5